MVAKFLKADLIGRKQNSKNRKGETGAILKCKAEQSRAEQKRRNNKNQSEQKGIKKE
jgi:hypothetical protein